MGEHDFQLWTPVFGPKRREMSLYDSGHVLGWFRADTGPVRRLEELLNSILPNLN